MSLEEVVSFSIAPNVISANITEKTADEAKLTQVAWNGALQAAITDAAFTEKKDNTSQNFDSAPYRNGQDSVPQKDGQPQVGPWQRGWRYEANPSEKYTQNERDRQWEIADPGHWVSPERKQGVNGWLAQQSQGKDGLTAAAVNDALHAKAPALGKMDRNEQGYMLQQVLKSGRLDLPNAEKLTKSAGEERNSVVAEQFAACAIDRSLSGSPGWNNRPDIERNTYANLALQAATGDKDKKLTEYDYKAVENLTKGLGEDGSREFTSELRSGNGARIANDGPFYRQQTLGDRSTLPQHEAERRLLTATIASQPTAANARSDARGAVLKEFGRSPGYNLDEFKAANGSPLAKTDGQRIALASLAAQDPKLTPEKLKGIQDRAMMANSAYLKDVDHPEKGYRDTLPSYIKRVDIDHPENTVPKEDVEKLKAAGLQDKFVDKKTGFAASLFYNTQTHTYTLSARGTDEPKTFLNNFRGDWGNNWDQGADGSISPIPLSKQYNENMKALSSNLKGVLGDKLTDFTGHSLGGGLASAGGMSTHTQTTTFDAAGLNTKTMKRYEVPWDESTITSYHVRGEALTEGQEKHWLTQQPLPDFRLPIAAGRQFSLEPLDESNDLVWQNNVDSEQLHGTDYFLRGLLIDPKHIDR